MSFVAQRLKDFGAVDYTPASNINAGDIVIAGNLVGVAPVSIASGTLGAIETNGTFAVATASATTFSVGDIVYFNTISKVATATATDEPIGYAVKACTSGETTVSVYLVQCLNDTSSSSSSSGS